MMKLNLLYLSLKKHSYICFIIFFTINIFISEKAIANNVIDSLETILKRNIKDTNRVKQLNRLSFEYRDIGEFEKGLKCGNEALELAQKLNFKRGMAESYNNIGVIYKSQGNYKIALENYLSSLKIDQELGNKYGVASSYNNIGLIHKNQGNYSEALEYQLKALKLRTELNDKKGMAASFTNIGLIYYQQVNYIKALEYQSDGLKINLELGNKRGIASSFINIGIIYHQQGDFKKALENYTGSLKVFEELGDKNGIAYCHGNIGLVYTANNEYEKALEIYFSSLKIREEIGDKNGIADSYLNIGNLYLRQNKVVEAKKNQLIALNIAKEINAKEIIVQVYSSLSQCDSIIGNYKDAYTYHKLFKQYSDSIFNEASNKNIAEMSAQYESEKKDNEIKLLNMDKEKQAAISEAESKKQKIITFSVVAGLLMVLIFSIFIYNRWRLTNKQKLIIELQKDIVEEKQKEILDSIHYAKRIQKSLLPTEKYIEKNINRLSKK